MTIKYYKDEEVQELIEDICNVLDIKNKDRIIGVKSYGSKSKRIFARCWAMSKIFTLADIPIYYAIEVLGEKWDKLSRDKKEQIVIHELLHIPKSFGGGLRPHKNFVTYSKVMHLWKLYKQKKNVN